jgi:DNA-binding MarR family transcriptional regulator
MARPATTDGRVAEIRAFNRFYTSRIGVLGGGLHGSRHPLPEARVLFELGRQERIDVETLRHRLDMDAGHLSRLLARLEDQGLIARDGGAGARQRETSARLTAVGGQERLRLDQATVQQWSGLLEAIEDGDQRRLLEAMTTIRHVLGGPPPGATVELRAPVAGELGWIVARHGALYADEYGWGEGFEGLVAQVVASFAGSHDAGRERAWIATVDEQPAGCVLCLRRDDEVAALRLLLVEPWARGLGLGGQLIDACTAFARGAGYRTLALWTNHPLTEARRLYERRGFALVSELRHRDWDVELVGQELELRL